MYQICNMLSKEITCDYFCKQIRKYLFKKEEFNKYFVLIEFVDHQNFYCSLINPININGKEIVFLLVKVHYSHSYDYPPRFDPLNIYTSIMLLDENHKIIFVPELGYNASAKFSTLEALEKELIRLGLYSI